MIGADDQKVGNLKCVASVQGSLMKLRVDQAASGIGTTGKGATGALRGTIKEFSRSSRKRLLETFAAMDKAAIEERGAAFLTLTYGQEWPSPSRAKEHLESFLKRVSRRPACESPCFVWKMEPQERGAPHFHVVILGWQRTPDGWPLTKFEIADMWGSVIGPEYLDNSQDEPRAPFTRIEYIRSFRRLIGYVAKYMAKNNSDKSAPTTPEPNDAPGGGLPPAGAPVGPSGFIYGAYLSTNGDVIEFVGRQWGVVMRKNLPMGEYQLVNFEADGRFEEFHGLIRNKWARIDKDLTGFTIFSEHAAAWFAVLIGYMGINAAGVCI